MLDLVVSVLIGGASAYVIVQSARVGWGSRRDPDPDEDPFGEEAPWQASSRVYGLVGCVLGVLGLAAAVAIAIG
ncbi:MAG: hypothetical protein AAF594_07100 [Bacteroidota bacterium]